MEEEDEFCELSNAIREFENSMRKFENSMGKLSEFSHALNEALIIEAELPWQD